jgi:TPR repeat protein
MDSALRAELVRQGNQAFNAGDYAKARDLFTRAAYKDGLIRIGDYYMYERRLPLLAYGYYKRAGANAKVEDLHRRMIGALGEWIGRDKIRPEFFGSGGRKMEKIEVDAEGMIPVPVAPELKELALKLLAGKR